MERTNRGLPMSPICDNWVEMGLTKREYAAIHAPAKEIEDIAPSAMGDCVKFLGLSEDETYDYRKHYPVILARLRAQWADALFDALEKEESHG